MNDRLLDFAGIGMTSQRTRDRLIQRLRDQGINNEDVLDVIASVPRHLFIDEALSHKAYEDISLPIGHGQTISQPHTVALMTQILLQQSPKPMSVLEVGTGCGYQTAILSQLVSQVYTIERIGALQKQAKVRMKNLSIYNVEFRHTDGTAGWPNKQYRFDSILMAAAADEMPVKMFEQLKAGGTMIFPFDTGKGQRLIKATQTSTGIKTEDVSAVSFVPLLKGTL